MLTTTVSPSMTRAGPVMVSGSAAATVAVRQATTIMMFVIMFLAGWCPSQTGLLRQVAGRWFEHRPAAHCMDCWGACSGPDQFHRFFFGRKMSGLICSGVMSIMAATVCT